MSVLGEPNKTIITVGIALISLSLGAILINRHSGSGSISGAVPVLEGTKTANIAEAVSNKNLKPRISVTPKTTKDTNLKDSSEVSPMVSQAPNNSPTPSKTPQTPIPTPTQSSSPSPTPSKNPTPTVSPTPSPTLSSSPSPTPSLTPTPTPPTQQAVVINEIAWMGTDANAADEWIELYNPGATPIDLDGWILRSMTSSTASSPDPNITLRGIIAPGGYFLLERSDSSTTDVGENQIYAGALNNTCEILELRDSQGNLKDRVDCGASAWFAGQGGGTVEKFSMERRGPELPGSNPASWANNDGVTKNGNDANGNPINGTPGFKNSQEI